MKSVSTITHGAPSTMILDPFLTSFMPSLAMVMLRVSRPGGYNCGWNRIVGLTPSKLAMITASQRSAQPSDWRRDYREAITDPAQLLRELGLEPLAARLPP